jgi:hypothetical protein
MQLQLTALVTIIGIIVMFGAWAFVGQRIKGGQAETLRTVSLLRRFFLFMGIFFAIMAAPNVYVTLDPAKFPLAMAWGYVVGHIFLYLAFITIAKMICTIVPRLASKEPLITVVGSVFTVAITIVNAVTMIWGTQPTYNYARHLIEYNASPLVGASIGILGLLTILPAAVLFFVNAVKNPARRTRSLLLAVGFLLITTAGPLHDVARTWQLYMAADIFSIIGIILVGAGVVYRLDQSLALNQPVPRPVTAGSNTV